MGDTTTHATTHHPTHGQHSSHQLVQLLPLVLLSSWATPACWWRAWQGELAQGKTTQHAQPHPPPSTPNHCPQAKHTQCKTPTLGGGQATPKT